MNIKIVSVNAKGHTTVEFTLDDGSTSVQTMGDCPADPDEARAFLEAYAVAYVAGLAIEAAASAGPSRLVGQVVSVAEP